MTEFAKTIRREKKEKLFGKTPLIAFEIRVGATDTIA